MKLLVVGQAPSARTIGRPPLSGPSGVKLARLVGASALSDIAEPANLLPSFPGKRGKGDAFPMGPAREAAQREAIGGRVVVLLGRKVAEAFGLKGLPYLQWCRHRGGRVVVVPHPSGVNRWWNEAANVAAAREVLVTALALGRQ